MITGKYPSLRLRRSRKNDWSRRLIEENNLTPNDFILPIFLIDGKNKKQAIKSVIHMEQHFNKEIKNSDQKIKITLKEHIRIKTTDIREETMK